MSPVTRRCFFSETTDGMDTNNDSSFHPGRFCQPSPATIESDSTTIIESISREYGITDECRKQLHPMEPSPQPSGSSTRPDRQCALLKRKKTVTWKVNASRTNQSSYETLFSSLVPPKTAQVWRNHLDQAEKYLSHSSLPYQYRSTCEDCDQCQVCTQFITC